MEENGYVLFLEFILASQGLPAPQLVDVMPATDTALKETWAFYEGEFADVESGISNVL
jgi:hypothetical protein